MALHYAPGVYVEHPRPQEGLAAVRMDVAGFVGIAERGPVDKAVALDGWPAFLDIFGNFLPNAYLAYSVRAFFENGGRRCHVVRVAASEVHTALDLDPTVIQPADNSSSFVLSTASISPGALVVADQTVTTTAAGVQPTDRGSTIVADIGGFAAHRLVVIRQPGKKPCFAQPVFINAGGNEIRWREPLDALIDIAQPFTLFSSHRCSRLVQSVSADQIVWKAALDPAFDQTKAIDFAAGAGASNGTIYDEDALPLISIEAFNPGQWGNSLSVSVRHSRGLEARSRLCLEPDKPRWLSVEAITGFAKGSIVEIVQVGAPLVRRRIAAVDVKTRRLFWDTDLAAPFDLAAAANGTNPIRVRRYVTSLSVRLKGKLAETFGDLDLPTLADPDASLVNEQSKLIRISRLGGSDYAQPDPTLPLQSNGLCTLSGGRDGIAMLSPDAIVGDLSLETRRGVRVFETVDEPATLAVPDFMIEPMPALMTAPPPKEEPDPCCLCPALPTPPVPPPPMVEATPDFSLDDVLAMQSTLLAHCETRGDRIALIDVPRWRDRPDPYDVDATMAWRQRFDSSYAALYFPWIELTDPLTLPNGKPREVPPSGHAAGCIARTDSVRGTQAAPANMPLQWLSSLPHSIDAAAQEGLNPAGINCIRSFLGRGIRIYGARTLSSDPQWRFLNVRRLIIRLKRALNRGMQWAVFEPQNNIFYDAVFAQVEGFLETEWDERRLSGRTADEAFYVRQIVDRAAYDRGEFILEIGVAPVIPAEFVVLRLSRTEDRLEIVEDTEEQGEDA